MSDAIIEMSTVIIQILSFAIPVLMVIAISLLLGYLHKFILDFLDNNKNLDNHKKIPSKERVLNSLEAEFLADYFHNIELMPDEDGYVGNYYLPEKVMRIYKKKYSEVRGWNE